MPHRSASEHPPALQDHHEDEGHEEVVREEQQGGPVEHHLAIAPHVREQLLVVEGDDGQRQREQHEDDGQRAEEVDVLEKPEEEMGVVEYQAGTRHEGQAHEGAGLFDRLLL